MFKYFNFLVNVSIENMCVSEVVHLLLALKGHCLNTYNTVIKRAKAGHVYMVTL